MSNNDNRGLAWAHEQTRKIVVKEGGKASHGGAERTIY
jgi:hypothetical protein